MNRAKVVVNMGHKVVEHTFGSRMAADLYAMGVEANMRAMGPSRVQIMVQEINEDGQEEE